MTNLATIEAFASHFSRLITFSSFVSFSTTVAASESTSIIMIIAIIFSTPRIYASISGIITVF
jgi:hypothetical protein